MDKQEIKCNNINKKSDGPTEIDEIPTATTYLLYLGQSKRKMVVLLIVLRLVILKVICD